MAPATHNSDAFRRMIDAILRRDIDAALGELDPDVEWHSAIMVPFGGKAVVARGHAGVAGMFRDFYEAFAEIRVEFDDVHETDRRVVAHGSIHIRGAASQLETESPWGYDVEFADGKVVRVRTFLDQTAAPTT